MNLIRRFSLCAMFVSIVGVHQAMAAVESDNAQKLLSAVARNYDYSAIRGVSISTSISTIQIDPGKTFKARITAVHPCFHDSAVFLITKDSLFRKMHSQAKPDTGIAPTLFDFHKHLANATNARLMSDTTFNGTRYHRVANESFESIWFWLGFMPPYAVRSAQAVYWIDAQTNLIYRITVVIHHLGTPPEGRLFAIQFSNYKNHRGTFFPGKITYSLPEISQQMSATTIKSIVMGTVAYSKTCATFETKYNAIKTGSAADALRFKTTALSAVDLFARILAEKVLFTRNEFTITVNSVETQKNAIRWSY